MLTYNLSSLDMWYLHAPDRSTPYEVTFKTVNELYKEGKFKRLGISNYMSYVLFHPRTHPSPTF